MTDPATYEAQEEARAKIDAAAVAAEVGVLAVIAERLGKILPDSTQNDAADWANYDEQKLEAAMSKGRAMIDSAVDKVFKAMDKGNAAWADAYYKATGTIPRSNETDAVLLEGRKKAKGRVGQLCRTSVTGIVDESGAFAPLYEGYRAAVSRAVASMAMGEATYHQAVAQAVSGLSRHGLKVRYESGAVRELYAAVDTNVMDGYRTTMNAQRVAHGRAFGADGVEVSAHEPCAPDHLPYQGRRFPNREWESIQVSLGRPLVTGANCHHTTSPVIMGIGESAWADQLADMNRRSTEAVTFKGVSGRELTMTRYEATQYQRKIEREIRRSKMDSYLMDRANMGQQAAIAEQRAKSLNAYYRSMSAKTGLHTLEERTRLYVAR